MAWMPDSLQTHAQRGERKVSGLGKPEMGRGSGRVGREVGMRRRRDRGVGLRVWCGGDVLCHNHRKSGREPLLG